MSIGIFDSGLGGLTVARAVIAAMPYEKIVYFGDTARAPYGNKSPEAVLQFARENTRFLLKKKADMIVVGCNTASAVAGQALRKEFPNVPIFEVITPAVREALRVSCGGNIGVIGTSTTVQSGAYQKWCAMRAQACPLFVPLVEAGRLRYPATYEVAAQYLEPMKRARIDTLILGCTHYPWLKTVIAGIMGKHVTLVDSAETVAREIVEMQNAECRTPHHPALAGGAGQVQNVKTKVSKHEFYVSKKTPKFQELAEKWLGQKINLKLASI